MPQQPWRDNHGRYIPPSRDHIGRIDHHDMHRRIRGVHDRWNHNDHDYHWYNWNGMWGCHRYDMFGYHWWGFYVGSSYFWTRYYEDRYWWYDPYWHRWVYLHDGRWWWQNDGIVYIIINNGYYRYGDNGGTVIVTPDPTPPVETPPTEPGTPAPAPDQTMFYSADGTRSVQILGERKEAFLYDLTVADQEDRKAKGRWLGAGVASAKFVYDDKAGDDGKPTQVLRQIELAFVDAAKSAVADINGEREVQVSGDARSAFLYNLKDDSLEPVFLADNETGVNLINEESKDAAGEIQTRLKLVIVTAKDDAGIEKTLMFDRNGASYEPGAGKPEDPPPPGSSQSMLEKVQSSPALRGLNSGFSW